MIDKQASEVLASLPDRICEVIRPWTEISPAHPALVESGGAWSYSELASVVAETRIWLANRSVRPGDRVMIVGENCRVFVALLLATADLDAWPVLVNARLSAREVDLIRQHCRARLLIYTTAASPNTRVHATRHGAAIEKVDNLGEIGVGALNCETETEPVEGEPGHRVAALIYTSGTTGQPKGVMLTHRNLLFVAAASARIRSLKPEDRLYGILPISHAVGLSVVLLGTLLSGATLYLAPRFDPMSARIALERDRMTVVLGVPSMFAQFLEYAKLRRLSSLSFPDLRIISSSGAPLDAATKNATEALFGLPLHNGYGITECSPNIAQTRPEAPRSDTSVGTLLPGMEARFIGPDGREVPQGEIGELWLRGPNIMKGYYRDPEQTTTAINAEGWFNTRDLAKLQDGNLFVVGRTKELIVHSGFNVYPAEVEAVLNAHPAVFRSAVVGRSINGDEQVLAFVELLPASETTGEELRNYAAHHLAPYKRPLRVWVLPALPLTPTGKIAKNDLAKRISSEDITLANAL
jgi:long-chain acyl-CoA synthetase